MKTNKLLIAFIFAVFFGCAGGGSEGTGIGTRVIYGTVSLEDGTPFSQANVTVLESGDSTLTDAAGGYILNSYSDTSSITLEVSKDDVRGTATLSGLDPDNSQVMADLVVTDRGDASLVSVNYLQIFAHIEGACAKYFSNKQIIRQTSKVPENLSCVLRFFASGDGQKLERIRGQIQVRTCHPADPWRPIAEGVTGTGSEAGFGDITFDFIDNRNNCLYRLIAPIDDPQERQTEIFIQTLTFQNRG